MSVSSETPHMGQHNARQSGNQDIEEGTTIKSIEEEEMLDIAEMILSQLAQSLIEHGWSVQDVFGQPAQILKEVFCLQTRQTVVAIAPENFLGRLTQLGMDQLSDLQIACLIRVIAKPDLDNFIVYRDLEMLMSNFGV